MKDKKIILLVLGVLSILVFAIVYKNVNMNNLAADSGFDSSWDSGGSDWGGSDWGGSDWGGSDWGDSDWGDSDWGDVSYSSGGRRTGIPVQYILLLVFAIVSIIIIITDAHRPIAKKKNAEYNILKDNKEALENLSREIPNFNRLEFYNYVYDNFVKVQQAWMNFDYEALRKLVTDELFNTYKSQMKTLEVKKQKNIMDDFDRSDIAIIGFNKSQNKLTVTLKMTVRFFDYLVDKDNKVVRGSKLKRLINTYTLTYVSGTSTKQNKCPNCNAPLDNTVASNVCPYCKSTIVNASHDFILSKKEIFEQRME